MNGFPATKNQTMMARIASLAPQEAFDFAPVPGWQDYTALRTTARAMLVVVERNGLKEEDWFLYRHLRKTRDGRILGSSWLRRQKFLPAIEDKTVMAAAHQRNERG